MGDRGDDGDGLVQEGRAVVDLLCGVGRGDVVRDRAEEEDVGGDLQADQGDVRREEGALLRDQQFLGRSHHRPCTGLPLRHLVLLTARTSAFPEEKAALRRGLHVLGSWGRASDAYDVCLACGAEDEGKKVHADSPWP